ncbi:MAG: hypothetical protein U1E76_07085 [Planctomycetota bacterium]
MLWLGCDDGFRVLLDNQLLASHHGHQRATPDEFPVRMALHPGANQLVLKVENWTDASGVYARITDLDGSGPGLRPTLDSARRSGWKELALVSPGFFSLDELLQLPCRRWCRSSTSRARATSSGWRSIRPRRIIRASSPTRAP